MTICLDTHVVVWLYQGDLTLFPPRVRQLLEDGDLLISPMAALEMKYLEELGRLKVEPYIIIEYLRGHCGLRMSSADFADVVIEAIPLEWTRDPFDRLIAADALSNQATLLTKDRTMLDYCPAALWE